MMMGSGMHVKASLFFFQLMMVNYFPIRIILAELIPKMHTFLFVLCFETDYQISKVF
jgi:hypothetical protein